MEHHRLRREDEPITPEDEKPKRLIKRIRGKARHALENAFQAIFPVGEEDKEKIPVTHLLSLVCSLGHLSFRAYNDPTIEGFEEFTTTANRVRYLDWDHLHESLEGVLKIHLKHARNVLDADFGPGTSDPYVIFATGASQVASEFKKNSENPVWNSTHYLLIKKDSCVKKDNSKLHIRMYDSDWAGGRTEEREHRRIIIKDDPLGSASLDMSELKEPGVKNWDIVLHLEGDNRKDRTTVAFTTELLSFENACDIHGKSEESDAWIHDIDQKENEYNWTSAHADLDIGRVTFQPIAFINAVKTGTQVWIHANTEAKAVAVAFRGTEANRFKDLITDLSIIPSKIKWKKFGECSLKLSPLAQEKKIRVHSGFKRAYHSVWSTVMEIVYEITDWSEDWTICVTGHSLGGALATLCSFDFANRINDSGTTPRIIMMNFGAPRLGNRPFIKFYKQTVKESYRVINKMDIIHKIPFFLKHVETEVDFEEDGQLYVNNREIADLSGCNEILKEEGIEAQEKPRKLTKKALFKTPGFKGHFENYYFDVVMRAIATLFQSDKQKLHNMIDNITHTKEEREHEEHQEISF